jgi:hypothetical protein
MHVRGQSGGVADDHADRLTAAQNAAQDLPADVAGGVVMTIMRASRSGKPSKLLNDVEVRQLRYFVAVADGAALRTGR